MNSKISREVEQNYNINLSDDELLNKYFYKKSNLWLEFIWLDWFKEQKYSEVEKKNLIEEFKSLEILKSKNEFWLIDLTKKLKDKMKEEKYLDKLFILEPYNFASIWKTEYGYNIHKAKGDSDIKVIKEFAIKLYEKYLVLNEIYKFNYIWFIPPTLTWRKIQIMDYIRDYFLFQNENIKILNISKIPWTPTQKSLTKFQDRLENAKNSFYTSEKQQDLWNILLIDDAVWSWTTLNFVAEKLRKSNEVKNAIWLAIVWSMRWFDVIKEI